MTWQGTKDRVRAAAVAARGWWGREVTRKRVVLTTLGITTALGLGVTVEALIRARIPDAASRAPTALYTRVAGNDSNRQPIPLGTVDGSLMEYRIPLRLQDFPDHLVDAVLAVEDQRFESHWGLDLRRIGGALVANVRAGGISQGGSTITQQLAKNLFLTHDRTPIRKLREAAMALVLEARHTKEEILEAYLNEIYLGQDRGAGIHGMGAAARYYFNKDAERLLLSEAATLAAMIPAPNRLSPQRWPETVRARRNMVLGLMADQGRITARARDNSARVAVPRRAWPQRTIDGRWFRDHVIESVPKGLPKRGAAVYTSLDPALQQVAEEAVRRGLLQTGNTATQAALVAIDPRTGEILAMVGGREYGVSQFNRAVQAQRQPGSAFKPIVALAALERQGNRDPSYTLASMVPDEPLSVRSGQAMWQPANFDGEFRGEVTLRQAMEQSLNVPFARIGMEIGPQRIVQTAKRLGISSPMQPVPALALGASEVSLLELVRAYGVLAAEGRLAEPRPIVMVVRNGDRMEQREPEEPRRVADPAAAWLVTSALEGVVDRGTGRGLGRGGIAGKTGTSNDFRDAWFVAYTPELVVGVWVGHDDGQSLRRTGSSVAVPIVARFLDQGRVRSRGFPMPDGIEEGRVGGGWFGDCGETEYFLEGTAPRQGACLDFDLDGLLDLFRGGGDDDDDRRVRRDRRDDDSVRPIRSSRPNGQDRRFIIDTRDAVREAERAVRQAEEWLREQGGEEAERLLAALERRIQRGRPR